MAGAGGATAVLAFVFVAVVLPMAYGCSFFVLPALYWNRFFFHSTRALATSISCARNLFVVFATLQSVFSSFSVNNFEEVFITHFKIIENSDTRKSYSRTVVRIDKCHLRFEVSWRDDRIETLPLMPAHQIWIHQQIKYFYLRAGSVRSILLCTQRSTKW